MAKMTSRFHFYMYQLRETYRQNMEGDAYDLSLLTLYGKLLRRYDDEEIEMSRFYSEHIRELPDRIEYAIVFLIVLDMIGCKKAITLDFEVLEGIITAFIKTKINPYQYELYLKVFLNEELLNKLSYLRCIAKIPLSIYLINIIKKYDGKLLTSCYWQNQVLRYICNILGVQFSPILKGNQSIERIKELLEEEIHLITGEEVDIPTLNLLDRIDRDFTLEQKDLLVEKLRTIENTCTSKEKAISLMLRTIRGFYKEQTTRVITFTPIKHYKSEL